MIFLAVRVDTTPPLAGRAYDGSVPSADANFSHSLNTIHASWAGFQDYESGIMQFIVTVYRNSPLTEITSEVFYGHQRQFSTNQLQLQNGDSVFVQVTGVNRAGGRTSVNTSGTTIDLTPPELSFIVDGNDPSADLQYQTSNSSLEVSWEISDIESGIESIRGIIYEIREGRRVRVYPDAGDGQLISVDQMSWNVDGLELNSGSRYIPSLTFTNGAGLEILHESDGVIVDSTPPTVVLVSVSGDSYLDTGETSDTGDTITNPNQTEARWLAIDMESGIQNFMVGVVNDNGTLVTPGYVIFDGTEFGGLIGTPDLPPEGLYRVIVVAVNRAGSPSEEAFSDTFRYEVWE